ncbi:MAG TPA: hypothetical protein VLF94_08340 [Chlamydiales bacterium]|nr:hypothetical protein [Chlamydiales bacterium]
MINALVLYRPFEHTKRFCAFVEAQWVGPTYNTCDEVAKKVGLVVLALLALPFFLVFDLFATAAQDIYRYCYPTQTPIVDAAPPRPAVAEPADPILANPYPGVRQLQINNRRFLYDAIHHSLQFHSFDSHGAYLAWIRAGMADDNEAGEPRINLHQWIAGCSIAHYLRVAGHVPGATRSYPRSYPDNMVQEDVQGRAREERINAQREHIRDMVDISLLFRFLRPEQQARALRAIMLPEENHPLDPHERDVVNRINARAHGMTLDPDFRREILGPVMNNIDVPPGN